MTDHPGNDEQPSAEAHLYTQALAVTNDPEWCRELCRALLYRADWTDIAQAMLSVDKLKAREQLAGHAYVTRLAELEAERAKFLDPNRPGE